MYVDVIVMTKNEIVNNAHLHVQLMKYEMHYLHSTKSQFYLWNFDIKNINALLNFKIISPLKIYV